MYTVSVTYAPPISWGAHRRSRCLAMHSALFTEVPSTSLRCEIGRSWRILMPK
jgi:hypothetical protein